MKQLIYSHSTLETEAIGEALCQALLDRGDTQTFVALYGEMGVGKTAFSRGFGRGLGIDRVKSPTYTVVNEHRGTSLSLFHFDMYRIQDGDDLFSIGYDDYLARKGYILCEWSEHIPDGIPENAISVLIERTTDIDTRCITIGGIQIEYSGT